MREAWLDQLEALLVEADEATAVVTVASVAGRELELDPEEVRGAGRRALLVLAAGGDPSRGLDLDGPAVLAVWRATSTHPNGARRSRMGSSASWRTPRASRT